MKMKGSGAEKVKELSGQGADGTPSCGAENWATVLHGAAKAFGCPLCPPQQMLLPAVRQCGNGREKTDIE